MYDDWSGTSAPLSLTARRVAPGNPAHGPSRRATRRVHHCTTTVPLMPWPWMVQWYANVPAVGNVIEAVPLSRVGIPAGAPCVSNVTLCCAANDHVTLPFRVTVTVAGVNWLLAVAATLAVPVGTVTCTGTLCVCVTVPTVPFTAIAVAPCATPVTTPAAVTVAIALLPDVNVV